MAIQACQDGTIVFTHDDGETRTMSVRDIIRAVDENKLAIANLTVCVLFVQQLQRCYLIGMRGHEHDMVAPQCPTSLDCQRANTNDSSALCWP